jgi:diacylglycerol kinase
MRPRSWFRKFYDAGRGCLWGMHGQSSFAVHFVIAVLVIALAAWLRVERCEWIALLLCITAVLCAELFNSAIEYLAKSITREHDDNIGRALDIASGAVLIAAVGSAVVGAMILGPPLWAKLLGLL